MKLHTCIVAMVAIAVWSVSALAAPPSTTPKASKKAGVDSTAARPRPAAKTTAQAPSVRTIDAINIEGEIAVPQVLFITSRDNRRYRDGLGKQFRKGTLDVARSMVMPNRLCVAGRSVSNESLKEE